jgi:glycerol-3-phosphate dehydrogenase
LLEAELEFCLNQEMAVSPEDFLIRRTGMLYFNIARLHSVKDQVLKFYQSKLNWNAEKLESVKDRLTQIITNSTSFK